MKGMVAYGWNVGDRRFIMDGPSARYCQMTPGRPGQKRQGTIGRLPGEMETNAGGVLSRTAEFFKRWALKRRFTPGIAPAESKRIFADWENAVRKMLSC